MSQPNWITSHERESRARTLEARSLMDALLPLSCVSVTLYSALRLILGHSHHVAKWYSALMRGTP
ncbi:hypothetical protein Taro_034111 [Colocasia esculenta]|uniref:Uncharacterized protein n=1 Tax=Colocasia esculenta TaxID=4460 RepID=A0A843W900_COLES|nr:hypothetical protein [Colocasia esculenta]